MSVKTYRKIVQPVQALQFTGGNREEVLDFFPEAEFICQKRLNEPGTFWKCYFKKLNCSISEGDYLIKTEAGRVYPCAKETFETTFEEVL